MTTQDLIAKLTAFVSKRFPLYDGSEIAIEARALLTQANQEGGRGERYPNGYCRICGKHEGAHFKPCKMLTSSINNKCPNKAPTYAAESPLKSPNPPTQELPAPTAPTSLIDEILAFCDHMDETDGLAATRFYRDIVAKYKPAPTSQEGLREYIQKKLDAERLTSYHYASKIVINALEDILSRHPIPVSTPDKVKAAANADWPLRERIGEYIDELVDNGKFKSYASDVIDDLKKILEETGHTVYPPMRGTTPKDCVPSDVYKQLDDVRQWAKDNGYDKAADWITSMQGKTFSDTVKEESLAMVSGKMGLGVEIFFRKYGQRTTDTAFLSDTDARAYLLGLDDSKGGK